MARLTNSCNSRAAHLVPGHSARAGRSIDVHPDLRAARHRRPDLRLQPLPGRGRRGHERRRASGCWARSRTARRGLETDLTWIDEQTGGKPYGVDLLLPAKFVDVGQSGSAGKRRPADPGRHREFVADLLDRYEVPPLPEHLTGRRGTLSVSAAGRRDAAGRGVPAPVRLVASALGPPPADLTERAHARGVVVAALVGTVEHARRQQAAGVDLIVAQGTEAGGHTGTVATMVLVPEVVRAVAPTPVLAAGGIVTGAQMAAAIALGARGRVVRLGLADHPGGRDRPGGAAEDAGRVLASDTVRSRSLTGKPARMLRTAWTDEWEARRLRRPCRCRCRRCSPPRAQQRITRSSATGGQRRAAAGHLLRRPGRRAAGPGPPGPRGRRQHGRRVPRRRRPVRRPARRLTGGRAQRRQSLRRIVSSISAPRARA